LINQQYHKKTHKFGVRMPRRVEQAHTIDKGNGNDHWSFTIQKEMYNVMVAFKSLEDTVQCHI
jgi:hypothetical protein